MACPQTADEGTAFNMEGSCEYIESAASDSRQWLVLHLGGLGEVLTTPKLKNVSCYKMLTQKERSNELSDSIKCEEFLD